MTVRNVTPAEAVEMTLEEYGPISADIGVALDGPMSHRGVVFYQSEGSGVVAGLWEIDAGRISTEFADGGETVHIVAGRLIAIEEGGDRLELGPGDVATFPPGWRGVWEFPEPMRKLYTVFKA